MHLPLADINECLEGSSGCDTNADCVDTQGSSTCTCREGFVGTGFLCERQCTTMFQLLLSGVGNCAVWRVSVLLTSPLHTCFYNVNTYC